MPAGYRDIFFLKRKNNKQGRPVAQVVEQAPHVQKLCPHCSDHRFDSTCEPLLRVIPPLSPLFPVYSSAVLSKKQRHQKPKNIFKKKRKKKKKRKNNTQTVKREKKQQYLQKRKILPV